DPESEFNQLFHIPPQRRCASAQENTCNFRSPLLSECNRCHGQHVPLRFPVKTDCCILSWSAANRCVIGVFCFPIGNPPDTRRRIRCTPAPNCGEGFCVNSSCVKCRISHPIFMTWFFTHCDYTNTWCV
uniref:Uncharacterized protein n=1 Tax=Anopheles minimus TaxID=112268 RepID=A0A182WP77_9DIPT